MTDNGKVRIDQTTLTFLELSDVEETCGASLSDLFTRSQARGMAALVWITKRRDDPTFTLDDALKMGPNDIEMVDAEGEVNGGAVGATPPPSAESGVSVPPTS